MVARGELLIEPIVELKHAKIEKATQSLFF